VFPNPAGAPAGDPLRFLAPVEVNRKAWFPDWARAKSDKNELRYSAWDELHFREKGFLGKNTEAMRSLKSLAHDVFGEGIKTWTITAASARRTATGPSSGPSHPSPLPKRSASGRS